MKCNECCDDLWVCFQCEKPFKKKLYCIEYISEEGTNENRHICSKRCLLKDALDYTTETEVDP